MHNSNNALYTLSKVCPHKENGIVSNDWLVLKFKPNETPNDTDFEEKTWIAEVVQGQQTLAIIICKFASSILNC